MLFQVLQLFVFLMVYRIQCDLTEKEKNFIVDVHNEYRGKLARGEIEGQPMACNMNMLTWDDELAKTAKTWTDACKLGHDSAKDRKTALFYYVGQNFGGSWNIKNIMDAWFNEHISYTYANLSCNGVCGHYTQLVWADTTNIGCASTDCSNPSMNYKFGLSFVCNYGPAGNWRGSKPYLSCSTGSCSLCDKETTCNSQKLCAKDCIFPFKYKDTWYQKCTTEEKPWCSFDRNYSGSWKYC